MGEPRVLLDVDGVLADFRGEFCQMASRICGRRLEPADDNWDIAASLGLTDEQRNQVWLAMDQPGVARNLDVLPGAIEGVETLAKVADVYFVTSPVWSAPTWSYDRAAWLKGRFGDELGDKVIHTRHKHLVVGDVFVDDKRSAVTKWRKAHPKARAVLWGEAHVNSPFGCSGWDELLRIVVGLGGRR